MSNPDTAARVLVYGAGFTGLALAERLIHAGVGPVVMVDPLMPLTFLAHTGRVTYRNWWAGIDDVLVRLANRTIDLLEGLEQTSAGAFQLDRRGDLLVTTSPEQLEQQTAQLARLSQHGLGPLREHRSPEWYLPSPETGIRGVADGIDVLQGARTLRALFGFLSPQAIGAVHSRRAGSLDGGKVAQWLWREVGSRGTEVRRDDILRLEPHGSGCRVGLASGATIDAETVVLAPGSRYGSVATRLGWSPPMGLRLEPQLLPSDLDHVVRADSPNLVSLDSERIDWSRPEIARIEREPRLRPLLGSLPGGFQVELGAGAPPAVTWHLGVEQSHHEWPPVVPAEVREAMVRVLVRLVPGAIHGRGGGRGGPVTGSYSVVTMDRHPIVGPLDSSSVFWLGGFGRHSASLALGAADLLARILGGHLPLELARPFFPDRATLATAPGFRTAPAERH